MKSKWIVVPSIAAALALCLAMLTALVSLAGTCRPLMLSLMESCAPPEETGLAQELYEPVVDMITGYLDESRDEFGYTVEYPDGVRLELFNSREREHMADCLSLFRLCRSIHFGSVTVLLLCAAILTAFREERRRRWLGLCIGFATALLSVLIPAVWGLIDFDSLFILFHRLSFSNDLWLMDPNTDLIIRLMPLRFFIRYAGGIAGIWLTAVTGCLAVSAVMLRKACRVPDSPPNPFS